MHIYMLDNELDWDHKWHSEGGELFERLVFKMEELICEDDFCPLLHTVGPGGDIRKRDRRARTAR